MEKEETSYPSLTHLDDAALHVKLVIDYDRFLFASAHLDLSHSLMQPYLIYNQDVGCIDESV